MSTYQELLGFIEEAVAADEPLERVARNLADLSTEVADEKALTDGERADLLSRVDQYRAELGAVMQSNMGGKGE